MSVATDWDYKGFDLPMRRADMDPMMTSFYQDRILGRLLRGLAAILQVGESLGVIFLNQHVYFQIDAQDFALHVSSKGFSRRNDHAKARLFERFTDQWKIGLPG
jgi:hypothetical protein